MITLKSCEDGLIKAKVMPIFLGTIILVVSAIGIFFVFQYTQNAGALAVVDGKKISEVDVQKWLWASKGFEGDYRKQGTKSSEAKEAIEALIELAILESEATKLGILYSDKEIKEYMISKSLDISSKASDDQVSATFKYNRRSYLRDTFTQKLVVWKEAEYIQIPLDTRYFVDPQGYISDKSYGRDLALSIYKQWSSGQITFDVAAKIAKDDPRLGIQSVKRINGFDYLEFGYRIDKEGYMNIPGGDFKTTFSKLEAGFNKPVVVVADIINPHALDRNRAQARDEREIIIAHVTKSSGQSEFTSYDDWYKSVRLKYKVST